MVVPVWIVLLVLSKFIGENYKFIYNYSVVKIIINRSKRARNISLYIVSSDTIRINIPNRLTDQENKIIDKVLRQKKVWINKQLLKFKKREQKRLYLPDRIEVDDKILTGLTLKNWAKQKIIYATKNLAQKYNFKFNRIFIRNQKTRWGSCSSRANLSFNYKIALLPQDLFEYILLHELVHLHHPHHQRTFWQELESICPNTKAKRKQLHLYSLN